MLAFLCRQDAGLTAFFGVGQPANKMENAQGSISATPKHEKGLYKHRKVFYAGKREHDPFERIINKVLT